MDDLISILRKSLKELGTSPILLIVGLAMGVLTLPMLAGYSDIDETIMGMASDFSLILLPLLVMPFFTGGVLGCAVEARNKGSTSLSTFVGSGAKNYAKMVLAAVISFVVYYFMVFSLLAFLVTGEIIDPFLGSILGLAMVVLTFLVWMAIEFYDVGIVADGAGVMAAFRNSIDFVRRNLASAIVFFIVLLILKTLALVPLSFGMADAMMSNETYYNALMNVSFNMTASNATALNNTTAVNATALNAIALNATAINSTALNSTVMNATAFLSMVPPAMSKGTMAVVGVFQVLIQGIVFSLLALFKTDFYLTLKQRKRITDFDYDFSDQKDTPRE